MKVRATFPFTVASAPAPVVTAANGTARVPASTYSITVSTVQALVGGIASVASGTSNTLVLAPAMPLDLTGRLGHYGAIAIDAILYDGIPLNDAMNVIAFKRDGTTPRRFITIGHPPAHGPAVAADWRTGNYGVYLERGAPIWKAASAASPLTVTLTLIVRHAATDYRLDGHELLRALANAGAFDPATPVPTALFAGPAPSTIVVVGPAPASGTATPAIERVTCDATNVQLFGPAPSATLPPELVYLGPAAGVDVALSSGAFANWTAATGSVSLGTASAASQLAIARIMWNTLPQPQRTAEAVDCTVTATPTGSSTTPLIVHVTGLAHPPVIDTGRGARAGVPLEGSPRVSVRVDDCTPAPATFANVTSVKLGLAGPPATAVAASPDGQRLYFTVPAGAAGSVDVVIDTGSATATAANGVSYVADVPAGFEGLKAALAVAAEEAAELAEQAATRVVETFCERFTPQVFDFQYAVATMLPRITAAADIAAWQQLVSDEAQLVLDTVNRAVATLESQPIASFDGQPFAGSDDEPDFDIGAFVIMSSALDNVVVRSSMNLSIGD
jgi:hypothetical protein